MDKSLTARSTFVGPVTWIGMKIGVVSQAALLRKAFATHSTGVGPLSCVYTHVAYQRVVNSKLALADLTSVGLLIGVGSVVEGELMLFIKAARTLVTLELSLRVHVQVFYVVLLV